MILISLAGVLLVCAGVPAVLFAVNLRRYCAPRSEVIARGREAEIAVLIPARNEEGNIAACLESVLANEGATFEVVVLDDASTDGTAEIVRGYAMRDARVRLAGTENLPPGWNGKQHACWLLAKQTDAPLLCFLDADVRLAPGALRRCEVEMRAGHVALLSGFPRQITVGWMERMLLPLIHFVLLGFLPLGRMRKTTEVGYAAGCGQFFVAEREAYFACGGHAAIRETRHDGLRLPQAFRRAGFKTDIVDLTELAAVRMYDSPAGVWMGLAKNATEGLGAPARIVPLTMLLLLGQVLPVVVAALWVVFCVSNVVVGATFDDGRMAVMVSFMLALAVAASYVPRLLAVRRFRQPLGSALLHPVGIVMLLVIQWYALVKQVCGRPVAWRARSYASGTGEEIGTTEKAG
ncbi:MAG: glycosyltransferase [Acidobacteria bacterium]|nr:glycosyltransferase [Acidobacteriota bacterium]